MLSSFHNKDFIISSTCMFIIIYKYDVDLIKALKMEKGRISKMSVNSQNSGLFKIPLKRQSKCCRILFLAKSCKPYSYPILMKEHLKEF